MSDALSHLLWEDVSVVAARRAKASAVIAAVEKALGRTSVEIRGAAEFRRLAEHSSFDGAIGRDPYTYYWARLAFELLGSVLRSVPAPPLAQRYMRDLACEDRNVALGEHLNSFKRLALGAALTAGEDILFDEPLCVPLPTCIPGTRTTLLGAGTVELQGVEGSRLLFQARESSSARVESCPVLTLDGREVRLQPAAFHLAGLDFRESVGRIEHEQQMEWRSCVEAALEIVEAHQPQAFRQFREIIQIVALQRGEAARRRSNLTHSDLPGAIVATAYGQPYYLGEILIHESHHSRLFCLEEKTPLLENEDLALGSAPRYYSPWQTDPRPIHGILHGVYVFIPVCRYWLSVVEASSGAGPVFDVAADRLICGSKQLRVGLHQVRRHAQLTEFGRQVIDELQGDSDAIEAGIDALGLPDDVPMVDCTDDGRIVYRTAMTAGRFVSEHLASSSLTDEAQDIRAHVAL